MIQDIKPHVFNNHYVKQYPDEKSVFFYVKQGKLLVRQENGEISYPQRSLAGKREDYIYVFSLDETQYFLCNQEALDVPEQEGYVYLALNEMRYLKPRHLVFVGVTAMHLTNWYRNNKYCGRCGKRMVPDKKERMMRCEGCGNMVFPKISPAVIVAVTKDNSILLTKYAGRSYKRYALIAGYTEIGETAEETVSREVMEEVGLKVKNIRYYKSQPWGFSETLLLGFFCDVDGDSDIKLDGEELSSGQWVPREELMEVQDGYDDISLTNEMIKVFLMGTCDTQQKLERKD